MGFKVSILKSCFVLRFFAAVFVVVALLSVVNAGEDGEVLDNPVVQVIGNDNSIAQEFGLMVWEYRYSVPNDKAVVVKIHVTQDGYTVKELSNVYRVESNTGEDNTNEGVVRLSIFNPAAVDENYSENRERWKIKVGRNSTQFWRECLVSQSNIFSKFNGQKTFKVGEEVELLSLGGAPDKTKSSVSMDDYRIKCSVTIKFVNFQEPCGKEISNTCSVVELQPGERYWEDAQVDAIVYDHDLEDNVSRSLPSLPQPSSFGYFVGIFLVVCIIVGISVIAITIFKKI